MSEAERTVEDTHAQAQPGLAEAVRCQRDLYLYWRTVRAQSGVPLTTRRFVTRPALRHLRDILALDPGAIPAGDDLAEGEDSRLFFLRRLLERLGLLTLAPDAQHLLPGPDEEMGRYLALPLAARIRSNVRLWVAGGWWPDRPDPRTEPPRIRVPAPPKLALARRRLIEYLAALDPGAPIPLPPELVARSHKSPHVSSPRPRVFSPAPGAATPFPSLESLPPETLATVRAACEGPLRWLGLVAVESLSTPEGASPREALRAGLPLIAVRATEETSASVTSDVSHDAPSVPDASASALPEVTGRVVIQPDSSVLALPPLSAPAIHLLDALAEEVALDTTARYRLSESALARALRSGWDVTRVIASLEALTGAPLPGNVRVLLGDWARRSERIRLLPDAILLEVPRPALLDALLREPGARGWIERRLTPTAALLKSQCVGAVRAWLLRHGEFPALLPDPAQTLAQPADPSPPPTS